MADILFNKIFDNYTDIDNEQIKVRIKIIKNNDPHCWFNYLIQIFDSKFRYFEKTLCKKNLDYNINYDELFKNFNIINLKYESDTEKDLSIELYYNDKYGSEKFYICQDIDTYNIFKLDNQIKELEEERKQCFEMFNF